MNILVIMVTILVAFGGVLIALFNLDLFNDTPSLGRYIAGVLIAAVGSGLLFAGTI